MHSRCVGLVQVRTLRACTCSRQLRAVVKQRPRLSHSQRLGCMPRDSQEAQLHDLLKLESLSADERKEVLVRFADAGFTAEDIDLLVELDSKALAMIGIEPQKVRSKLLKSFETVGGPKSFILQDAYTGESRCVTLHTKRALEALQRARTILFTREGGVVADWEDLQDGESYFTSPPRAQQG